MANATLIGRFYVDRMKVYLQIVVDLNILFLYTFRSIFSIEIKKLRMVCQSGQLLRSIY